MEKTIWYYWILFTNLQEIKRLRLEYCITTQGRRLVMFCMFQASEFMYLDDCVTPKENLISRATREKIKTKE